MPPARLPAGIPMRLPPSLRPKEGPMLDVLFIGGGLLLFTLLIAYERLCGRL